MKTASVRNPMNGNITRFAKIFILLLILITLFGRPAVAEESVGSSVNEEDLNGAQSWWVEIDQLFSPLWEKLERISVSDGDWFMVYKLPNQVYALYEPYQEQSVISYLITGEETALLWDTGLGIGDIKACVADLTDLPVTVLNSHDHFDHIGGNAQFEQVMCYNVDTAIERLTHGIPHEELVEWINPDAIVNPPDNFSPDTFFTAGKAPTATVEDGQMIDLGNRKLEIVYTPGHSNSCIILIDEQNGLLFTGDTWYPGWLYLFPKEYSLAEYLETMRKVETVIREKNIQQIYPSHNVILTGTEMFHETMEFMERIENGQEEYEIINGNRLYILDEIIGIMFIDQ